jgi:hypothetical protein
MGIIGYYVGRYKEGKEACLKAIEAENQELDRNNLKFYIAKELELIQGGNLGCPALIAVSILDKEVRSKEEFELKHDRSKAARDIINTISAEQKAKSQPISSQILETLCRVNGIGVSASAVANPTPAQASNMVMQDVNPVNSVAPDMAAPILKGNRRDRRSKLREMVNLKRKEEVATKAKKR